MIRLFLGNVGSGKTACLVRELILNPSHRTTYSNIVTKKVKNNVAIKNDMLIENELIETKVSKNGEAKPVYKKTFNKDFWKETVDKEGCINVVLDEAHTLLDSRRAMSTKNKIMGDFMAMLRRILGNSPSGYGTLTLITQLDRRLDVIAREMATQVRFHRCHYTKYCKDCGCDWEETSDDPEPEYSCPNCNSSHLNMKDHEIEVWHFRNIEAFEEWKEYGSKTFHLHYMIDDIVDYFPYYDTVQWDNLFTED